MRHLIIILLFTFGLLGNTFSDVGNCVKYQVDLQLNDGQKIKGFVYVIRYGRKFQFQDNSFLDYLKQNNSPDTLYIYKNIQQLKFPTTTEGAENCQFHFDATTSDNEIKILKKAIKTVKLISYTVCNNCDDKNEETGYHWFGMSPTVIIELTQAEIDLLQTKPIATINFGHDDKFNPDSYWMISYSLQNKQPDLEKLRNDYLKEANQLLKENKWDSVQAKYKVLKSRLRQRNIILFKIGYAI